MIAALFLAACGGSAEPEAAAEVPAVEEAEAPEMEEAEEPDNAELSLAQLQEKGVLVVGTAITKPFEYHDPDTNELIGFDVDVANYIAERLGVTVEFSEMPFASLIPSLETRKVDMTIAAMYIKPEREEVVDFATPYMETGLVMVVSPELAGTVKTTDDLNGLKVGVKIGATGDALAQDLIAQGIDLERLEYKETLESFADLGFGRIDVVLNDYLNTLAYLKDTGSDAHVVMNDDGTVNFLSNVGLGIAVHDGDAELLAEINAALEEMHADGTYDALYEEWLGVVSSDDPSLAQVQEKGVLVVGTAITKPFEYHDPDTNELIGFDVDVANYIAERLGVTVEFSEMPFASLIPSLETRKVDMTIAAMYIKPEREEVIDFATPYMETGLVMVVSPELADTVKTTDDLNGLKVGVKIGATGDALAQDLIAQGIELERLEYKETLESFADLGFGRVDVVLNDYLNTLAYLKDTGSDAHVVMNDDGTVNFLSHVGLGIAVHDGDATLLAEINAALEEMHANGTYDELYEKWLGVTQ